jgi:DNA-directed RNA polymerase subunit RPC12/RpoP
MIEPITPCTCITAHDRMVCVGWCNPEKSEEEPEPKLAREWLDGDTWDDCLVCPYCGDKTDYGTAWECLPKKGFEHDGDRTWVECDECGKEFRVSLSVTYEFRTDPIPNPEKKP